LFIFLSINSLCAPMTTCRFGNPLRRFVQLNFPPNSVTLVKL
jgi:hypothetical protein